MKRITAAAILLSMLFGLVSCAALREADETGRPAQSPEETEKTGESNVGSENSTHASADQHMTEHAETAETDTASDSMEPIGYVDPWAGVDISFMAVGDNLVHANIWNGALSHGTADKKYDFIPMFEELIPFIDAADVAFINQETVMAGDSKYGITAWPCFNSPQQIGYDLAELGFDIVNVATNHILDKGESGYRDHLDFMNSLPFTTIGGYYNKADHDNIRVTEVHGVKIAWLSYTEHTNGISLPAGSEMYVPYAGTGISQYGGYDIDEELIKSDLAAAEAIADVTIVSLHFGSEYIHFPNEAQKKVTQLIADNGAEVIIGHHSHCLQPIEWLEGANGEKTLCIYSLGNIASGQNEPLKLVGGIFTFRIVTDGFGGLDVVDPRLDPTVMYYDVNWLNDKVYLLENYTEDLAATHGMLFHKGFSLTPDEAIQIVKGCIDEEYLPDWMK